MFNAYKRFFAFAGKQKKTWYKGMGYELLRSIFEAIQFIALLVVLRALVEQNVTGETALAALGVMLVSVTGAAVSGIWPTTVKDRPITICVRKKESGSVNV